MELCSTRGRKRISQTDGALQNKRKNNDLSDVWGLQNDRKNNDSPDVWGLQNNRKNNDSSDVWSFAEQQEEQ